MDYQRKASAGKVNIQDELDAQNILCNVQRLLKPIRVVNPYAEHLALPKSVFKPRRTNAHYLHFIEAVTFYHQHQREPKYDIHIGEEYIETTLEDIAQANGLIKNVLLRKSDPLNGATRNYLECLKAHLSKKKEVLFTNQEIRRELRVKESTLRRYHLLLSQEGYIKKRDDLSAESHCYEVVDVDEFRQLEDAISMALGTCLEKLQSAPEGV